MQLHRLAVAAYADLSGMGGEFADGRWHTMPCRVVYLASTCALALCELLVHTRLPYARLPPYVHLQVDVPDDVWDARETVTAGELPEDWKQPVVGDGTRDRGDAWRTGLRSALLEVPSAIVPTETNVLLNPLHDDWRRCPIVSSERFEIDRRLLPKA